MAAPLCPPLPWSSYRPAAGATLQGPCRKGYAAYAPTAALATYYDNDDGDDTDHDAHDDKDDDG